MFQGAFWGWHQKKLLTVSLPKNTEQFTRCNVINVDVSRLMVFVITTWNDLNVCTQLQQMLSLLKAILKCIRFF